MGIHWCELWRAKAPRPQQIGGAGHRVAGKPYAACCSSFPKKPPKSIDSTT